MGKPRIRRGHVHIADKPQESKACEETSEVCLPCRDLERAHPPGTKTVQGIVYHIYTKLPLHNVWVALNSGLEATRGSGSPPAIEPIDGLCCSPCLASLLPTARNSPSQGRAPITPFQDLNRGHLLVVIMEDDTPKPGYS